jgi:beta-lactamase class A
MGKLKLIIFVFVITVFSMTVGYFLPKEKVKKMQAPVSSIAPNFSSNLLNPILPYYEQIDLDYTELKSFKAKIEKRIQSFKNTHKDLHVSYYFRDLNNGLWMGINEQESFSPASLFKVPLMIALLKKAESDPKVWEMGVDYKKADLGEVPEESGFKKEDGKFYTIADLLTQMIVYSDNTASMLLLQFVGDEAVMKVIDELNMHVGNGFDQNTNFVTVKAYAGILRILYNATYLNKEMSEKALNLLAQSKYNKGIRAGIPAHIKVAHKYGKRDETVGGGRIHNLQLHHFGLVFHPKKPFIIGVMTRGADVETKLKVIQALSEITYLEVDKQTKDNVKSEVFSE